MRNLRLQQKKVLPEMLGCSLMEYLIFACNFETFDTFKAVVPEAVAAVLSHYAGYIRSCAKIDGHINTDMQEHIVRQLIESLLKFRFDR